MHSLPAPMMRAVELAWESFAAGSFGIGAVVTRGDGGIVSTGRNRLLERDPGDDVLAGTSLAHAEMNALAKLRYLEHEHDDLQLYTTLQPCVQCAGAIRFSSVRTVHVLAPDPLFRGIEGALSAHPWVASRWPVVDELAATPWSVLALLFPMHLGVFWNAALADWVAALPRLHALAADLAASLELVELAAAHAPLEDVAAQLWERLVPCVREVEALRDVVG